MPAVLVQHTSKIQYTLKTKARDYVCMLMTKHYITYYNFNIMSRLSHPHTRNKCTIINVSGNINTDQITSGLNNDM